MDWSGEQVKLHQRFLKFCRQVGQGEKRLEAWAMFWSMM